MWWCGYSVFQVVAALPSERDGTKRPSFCQDTFVIHAKSVLEAAANDIVNIVTIYDSLWIC